MKLFSKKWLKKRNRSFLPSQHRPPLPRCALFGVDVSAFDTRVPYSMWVSMGAAMRPLIRDHQSLFASQWIDVSSFDTRVSYSVFSAMGRVLNLRSSSRNPSTFPSVGDPFCSDGFAVQSTLPSGFST